MNRRGFTLIELLLVLGLLVTFSFMAFQLLSGGLGVWRVAEESRDQEERARLVLDLVRSDLGQLDGSTRGRLLVDYAEGAESSRLRFDRVIGKGAEARALADAGAATKAPARAGETVASAPASPLSGSTMGIQEIAYAAVDDPASPDPAFLVLRRAARFAEPDDGAASIFAKDYFERPRDGFLVRSQEMAGGVLHFGLTMVTAGEPLAAWDSTRGTFLTPKGSEPNRFPLSLERPALARERVFPRRVRLLLILEREEQDRRLIRLAKEADSRQTQLVLDDPRALPVAPGDLVKVGTEWMTVAGAEPRSLKVAKRGALVGPSTTHPEGSVIHRGRAFVLEVPIAMARDAIVPDAVAR